MPMSTSSGTNWPLSIKLFASSPRGVRLAISSRSKLPVDRWISLYFSTSLSDCVPFPLPGGPNRIKLNISEYREMSQMGHIGHMSFSIILWTNRINITEYQSEVNVKFFIERNNSSSQTKHLFYLI